ncbi:beta-ketoacyl synthase domain-containing protein [Phlyctema vagabunda]|uniref:Beta-ketoacyl synthase domain-containing protein n=1 Tax=Phlyctema vagabunda TaxID=108571 RepID=A0ABR4P1M1_9HELO
METSELFDESEFADIGVDSLMSLSVTGRIREELDIDVPTSIFVDNTTIGEAKAALLALRGDEAPLNSASSDDDEDGDFSDGEIAKEPNSSGNLNRSNFAPAAVIDKILEIISDELGTEPSELNDTAEFGDIGVDSLMSLSITGRIREELDIDIPSSFFTDNPTVSDAKTAIVTMSGESVTGTATPTSYEDSPLEDSIETFSNSEDDDSERPKLAATSILLRGNPKLASKTLFLFPDGSGSATSYSFFPPVSPSICIYGLNCPFMQTPADYTNGIKGVVIQYLSEVKRRQSKGPYNLGGWSAGGVLAYQAACELQKQGEVVESLVLIDAPCPIGIEPLPSELLHFIESKGLLVSQSKSATPPSWLIPHFEASVRNLASYEPVPMDPWKAPKTFIIWAGESLYQNPDDDGRRFPRSEDEPSSIAFLLDDRKDFGSNGWGKLLGEENITCVSTEGNHFTMIREPAVKKMSDLLSRGIGVEVK